MRLYTTPVSSIPTNTMERKSNHPLEGNEQTAQIMIPLQGY